MMETNPLSRALEPLGVAWHQSPQRASLRLPDGQEFSISIRQDIDDVDEGPTSRPYLVVERQDSDV